MKNYLVDQLSGVRYPGIDDDNSDNDSVCAPQMYLSEKDQKVWPAQTPGTYFSAIIAKGLTHAQRKEAYVKFKPAYLAQVHHDEVAFRAALCLNRPLMTSINRPQTHTAQPASQPTSGDAQTPAIN